MLPVIDEIETHKFLKKAFSDNFWIILFIFIIYMAIILRLSIRKDTFECVFESLTICCWSLYVGLKSSNLRKRLIYFQLFLFGFIISNLYMSKMASYLSSTNRGRNLENFQDIVAQKLKIWASVRMSPYEDYNRLIYPEIYRYQEILPEGQFTFNVSKETFDNHLYKFNNSLGYLIYEYAWRHIFISQRFLKRKIFSFSKLCPIFGYLYPIDILFDLVSMDRTIDLFNMRVLEGGFLYIWEELTYLDLNYRISRELEVNFRVLGFRYFEIAWIILFLGLTFCGFAFFMEIVWNSHCSYEHY